MAYNSTSVPVDKSQAGIRDLLKKFGAEGFSFTEGKRLSPETGKEHRVASTQFLHRGQQVRMMVELKMPDPKAIDAMARRARTRSKADILDDELVQEERRIWRVLFHTIKARLVAVEEHVETFEQAFLAHLIDPSTGRTLYESMAPAIDAGAFRIGGEGMRALPAPQGGR